MSTARLPNWLRDQINADWAELEEKENKTREELHDLKAVEEMFMGEGWAVFEQFIRRALKRINGILTYEVDGAKLRIAQGAAQSFLEILEYRQRTPFDIREVEVKIEEQKSNKEAWLDQT